MASEAFFRRAAKAIKRNGAYSQHDDFWTIGIPHLQEMFEELSTHEPEAPLRSYTLILEEGERRGFWIVNGDHEHVADFVVIRPLIDKP